MLSEAERDYLRRRARLLRWWPAIAALMLIAILGLWGWLLLHGSLLVNPWALLQRIEAGQVGSGTLAALAVLGSMGFLALGAVMIGVVAVLWSAVRNERRLLDLLHRLDR